MQGQGGVPRPGLGSANQLLVPSLPLESGTLAISFLTRIWRVWKDHLNSFFQLIYARFGQNLSSLETSAPGFGVTLILFQVVQW